jgi:predicted DNA-binding transcriptional regulator AlpA
VNEAHPRHNPLPPSLPPRGLCREAAAAYIGVSASKFDDMVKDGRMPAPIPVDARRIWDRVALDHAFDALAASGERDTSWEGV